MKVCPFITIAGQAYKSFFPTLSAPQRKLSSNSCYTRLWSLNGYPHPPPTDVQSQYQFPSIRTDSIFPLWISISSHHTASVIPYLVKYLQTCAFAFVVERRGKMAGLLVCSSVDLSSRTRRGAVAPCSVLRRGSLSFM